MPDDHANDEGSSNTPEAHIPITQEGLYTDSETSGLQIAQDYSYSESVTPTSSNHSWCHEESDDANCLPLGEGSRKVES